MSALFADLPHDPGADGENPVLQRLAGRSSNKVARERRTMTGNDGDFFRTPPGAVQALLEREVFPRGVWEPACGDGAISEELAAAGHVVHSTDLFDRGYGMTGQDFLRASAMPDGCEAIITNPPFKLGTRFVDHALHLGARKVAMLCRVWVFSGRITLWRGDDPEPKTTGGAMAFGWFVWERHHRGASVGFI